MQAGIPGLAGATKSELAAIARDLGVKGRSKMTRAELEKTVESEIRSQRMAS